MSQSEVIDIVISQAEATSISEVASKIVDETKAFAAKWDTPIPYDMQKIEEDLIIFLTKRKKMNIANLRVTILEGGDIAVGDAISGQRRADLIFRISYKSQGGSRTP